MEIPKRLPPLSETLRRLYSLSGNQCTYPGCCQPMFNNEGNFVGQICHIEAALPGGERFNSNMSNEQRRSFDNLVLMCYAHHIETNKVILYPVYKMQEMKRQHEEIYSNIERFVHQMQSTIYDVTANINPVRVTSLSNLYVELYGLDDREQEDIEDDVRAFNKAISKLSSFSPEAKKIFAISLSRAKYEVNYSGRITENIYVDPFEIERVTQLESHYLRSIFQEIEASGYLNLDQLENGQWIFRIYIPGHEANLWEMVKKFCNKKRLDIVEMVSNLNFADLD